MRWSLGGVRQWHWISSAVCLVGMLLFAITGITLNHAGSIPAEPHVQTVEQPLPEELVGALLDMPADDAPLPAAVREWLAEDVGLHVAAGALAQWSEDEVYLALPRPGGDAWLSLDLLAGELLYERTDRGWISYLNDLHKGRHTGIAWSWFIDLFALACVVFCLTGLWLLVRYAVHRPATWPLVAMGFVLPLVLIILFVH